MSDADAGEAVFQSAPLTDVRGDISIFGFPYGGERFQSAPLTDVRGDQLRAKADLIFHSCFNPLPSLM